MIHHTKQNGKQLLKEVSRPRHFIKKTFSILTLSIGALTMNQTVLADQDLKLTTKWDKTFTQSDKVQHKKITFKNRYGITLAADLYIPKNAKGKLAAIVVSGPFGAVKEQSSGLYAQQWQNVVLSL